MIEAQDAHHSVVYRDEHAYCAHPHVAASSGGAWMIVFNVGAAPEACASPSGGTAVSERDDPVR